MGSCLSSSSSEKEPKQPQDSAVMKFSLPFASKTQNHLIIPSPVKHKSSSVPPTGIITFSSIFLVVYVLFCLQIFFYCFLLSSWFPAFFYCVWLVWSTSLGMLEFSKYYKTRHDRSSWPYNSIPSVLFYSIRVFFITRHTF